MISLRENPVFAALVSPAEKNRLRKRAGKRFPRRQIVCFTVHQ